MSTKPHTILAATTPPIVVATGDPKNPIAISATVGVKRPKTVKRGKLTTVDFKAARAQAIAVTGYDAKSPIYGKMLPDVLDMALTALGQVKTDGSGDSDDYLNDAITYLNSLKSRALTRKLIGQARA